MQFAYTVWMCHQQIVDDILARLNIEGLLAWITITYDMAYARLPNIITLKVMMCIDFDQIKNTNQKFQVLVVKSIPK